jgi:hypothetical protein
MDIFWITIGCDRMPTVAFRVRAGSLLRLGLGSCSGTLLAALWSRREGPNYGPGRRAGSLIRHLALGPGRGRQPAGGPASPSDSRRRWDGTEGRGGPGRGHCYSESRLGPAMQLELGTGKPECHGGGRTVTVALL